MNVGMSSKEPGGSRQQARHWALLGQRFSSPSLIQAMCSLICRLILRRLRARPGDNWANTAEGASARASDRFSRVREASMAVSIFSPRPTISVIRSSLDQVINCPTERTPPRSRAFVALEGRPSSVMARNRVSSRSRSEAFTAFPGAADRCARFDSSCRLHARWLRADCLTAQV